MNVLLELLATQPNCQETFSLRASISVGYCVRLNHFLLFGRAEIRAPFFPSPQFSAQPVMLQRTPSETLLTPARNL